MFIYIFRLYMTKTVLRSFFIAAFLIGSIFAIEGSAQTVSGSISNGTVPRGKTTRGVVRLSIPAGLHVNSSSPNSEYSIPTRVTLSATGIRVGAVKYPKGTDRKFQFSPNVINVYEGNVSFPFTVTVPANFRGKSISVKAIVRFQACTEEVCYPPKNKEITLTARIR